MSRRKDRGRSSSSPDPLVRRSGAPAGHPLCDGGVECSQRGLATTISGPVFRRAWARDSRSSRHAADHHRGPFERNYSEGWNAFHADRVAVGAPLYTGNPLTPVNYPFVSFYLIAWLSPWLGGVLMAGRLLNLASLGITALGVGCMVRRLGGERSDAAMAALAALGFCALQAPQWIAVDDPQALGQAFMILALACHVGGMPTRRRLLATALLVAFGAFTKHNLLGVPIAVTLDIGINHRRWLVSWCLFLAATLLLFIAAGYVIGGGHFLAELLTPREWHWTNLIRHTRKFLICFELPVLAAVILLSARLPQAQGVLLRGYGMGSSASSVAFAGGDGVSYNIFLDTTVFLAISVGVGLSRWRSLLAGPKSRRVTYMLLPVFLLSPLLVRSPVPLSRLSELGSYGRPFAAEAADFAAARRLLAERPGAAICESLLLCWSAGKSLVLDPFNSYQQFRTGSLDETGLLAAIARRGFAAIQVRSPIRFQIDHTGRERIDLHPPIRFTNNFYHAVLANYELASSSAIPIYVPRRATPSE